MARTKITYTRKPVVKGRTHLRGPYDDLVALMARQRAVRRMDREIARRRKRLLEHHQKAGFKILNFLKNQIEKPGSTATKIRKLTRKNQARRIQYAALDFLVRKAEKEHKAAKKLAREYALATDNVKEPKVAR